MLTQEKYRVHVQLCFFEKRAAEKRPVLRISRLSFEEGELIILAFFATEKTRYGAERGTSTGRLSLSQIQQP